MLLLFLFLLVGVGLYCTGFALGLFQLSDSLEPRLFRPDFLVALFPLAFYFLFDVLEPAFRFRPGSDDQIRFQS